jgi:predicted RNA-binding protein with PIN domain
MQALLRFTRLPEKALETVRRALDDDEGFRRHVASEVDADDLSPGGRLFLQRPEGWQEELGILVGLESERRDRDSEEELRARVEQLDREATTRQRRLEEAERSVESERDRVAGLEEDLRAERRVSADLRAEVESALEERARAVRQLKEAEGLAERRLEALRAASSTPSPPQQPSEASDGALEEARVELLAAAEAAGALASRLAAAADSADRGPRGSTPALESSVPREPARRASPPGHTPRRIPRRMDQGIPADSADGLAQLMGVAGMVVLVDGYNVSMAGWPGQAVSLQRDRLVDMLAALVANRPAQVHVVFDGDAGGDRPAVRAALPVRVHFTEAGVEADDRLIDFAGRVPVSRPVTVVSSDRRVREGARNAGANVVSASALLDLGRR